jgi:actin-like ATPase involved in cell morphogenesis
VSYCLGVDVGTSKTAAAVFDGQRVEAVPLGIRSPVVPSVVFRTESGALLFGDPADRRGTEEPDRVAREFKRRVGDPVPLIVGGTPIPAQRLMASTVQWVVSRVRELRGASPDDVVVAHPANWGPYKRDAYGSALHALGITAHLVTEPECAAARVPTLGRYHDLNLVAVYDLGGGTFDAAVLRRQDTRFQVIGSPQGIETLGGVDVDESILEHVWTALGPAAREAAAAVPAGRLTALRREVVEAKEHLSEDTRAQIAVNAIGDQGPVLLQRSELEERIQPLVSETITCLRRALHQANTDLADVDAVLLVGGASRMPLVAEMVTAALRRPVLRDTYPQLSIALGAATLANPTAPSTRVVEIAPGGAASAAAPGPALPRASSLTQQPAVRMPPTAGPAGHDLAGRRRRRRTLIGVAAIPAGAAVIAGAVSLLPADDADRTGQRAASGSSTTSNASPADRRASGLTEPTADESTPSADDETQILARGTWSDAKQGFELTVTEVGIRDGQLYAALQATNSREEGVRLDPSAMQLKDPGGRTHGGEPFNEGGDWPDEVPPGDTVNGTIVFENAPRSGASAMRLDTGHIFVPAPTPDLWNGLSITGIRTERSRP